MDQVNFLINVNQTSIDLATSFMFTPQSCRSITFKVINTFNVSTMQWKGIEDKHFYPQKTRHLHGCSFIIDHEDVNSLQDYLIVNLVKTFIKYTQGRLVISLEDADVYKHFSDYNVKSNQNFMLSVPILFEYWVVLMSPGAEFSQLEKMLMPFDYEIWIAIISTLFLALVISEIINKASNKARNFVFGIKSPTFELISTFFSGRQSKSPKRNFARFCLMLFIIWSLIIRTFYQSLLYKNFQADIRKPELKDIFEAIKKNYTYCVSHLGSIRMIWTIQDFNMLV